jgi:hypothetical protein
VRALQWSLLLVPLLAPPVVAAPPTVSLKDDAVEVTGVTPGGKVAVFGIARRSLEYLERVERQEQILLDADKDGVVTLELAEPLPSRSLWFAVDLAGGEFRAASPDGSPLRQITFPANGIGAARNDLQDRRDFVEVFLARPGAGADAGAWGLSAGDGGEADGDGRQDRFVKTLLAEMVPVAGSPKPPERMAPGDVLVVVDPDQMEFYAVRLGGN